MDIYLFTKIFVKDLNSPPVTVGLGGRAALSSPVRPIHGLARPSPPIPLKQPAQSMNFMD
jgi:hypothetical protein